MKELLIEQLHGLAIRPFLKWRNNSTQWNEVNLSSLLQYPEGTLGFGLGCFLLRNNFELQPRFEDHDVMHVLTGIGVTVQEEIGMHYFMLGNGKRSLYSLIYILAGSFFYMPYMGQFLGHYKRGKRALGFHNLEFLKLLPQPVKRIQDAFQIK